MTRGKCVEISTDGAISKTGKTKDMVIHKKTTIQPEHNSSH